MDANVNKAEPGMTVGANNGRRVAVVGAGAAGLSCAIELAAAGYDVLLLEKEPACGGKLRAVEAGGAVFDGGPTVFTMRWVFEELFARAGQRLDEALGLKAAGMLARHAWQDGSCLDLFASREESASAIAHFAGGREAEGYLRFCRDAAAAFETLRHSYIEAQRPNPVELAWRVASRNPLALASLRPFSTLWSALGSYFADPRLRQLYGRYATYCGSSPFEAPATLMLVAHVEQEGVWLVQGGMRALAAALENAALALGVEVRRKVAVETIARDRAGFELRTDAMGAVRADAVVWCGDISALAGGVAAPGLVRDRPVKPADRSLSAMVWTLRGRAKGLVPAHHTVCFSRDYRGEFARILGERRLPDDPTVYLCAQDRGAGTPAQSSEAERLYLLVNAPADGDRVHLTASESERCLQSAMNTMERCGLALEVEEGPRPTAPQDWHRLFPATGGALYGRASHGWTASFRRAGSRAKAPGLYLAGGSVHPGPGVPMAAISGRLAAQSLIADTLSMRRSHPAAIAGGMSTA